MEVTPPKTSLQEKLTNEALMKQCMYQLKINRKGEAALIELLSEIDERKLFAEEGYASMFKSCTGHLHLSKPAPDRCNSPAHWGKPGAFGTILWP